MSNNKFWVVTTPTHLNGLVMDAAVLSSGDLELSFRMSRSKITPDAPDYSGASQEYQIENLHVTHLLDLTTSLLKSNPFYLDYFNRKLNNL